MILYINKTVINNLNILESKLKKPILSQLISLYFSSTSSVIVEMREAVNNKELKALNRIAHSFKSSSANLGIDSVAKLCENIEYKSIEESPSESLFLELEGYIDSISIIIPHVLNELENLKSQKLKIAS